MATKRMPYHKGDMVFWLAPTGYKFWGIVMRAGFKTCYVVSNSTGAPESVDQLVACTEQEAIDSAVTQFGQTAEEARAKIAKARQRVKESR